MNNYFRVRLEVEQNLRSFAIERGVWAKDDLVAVAMAVHDMRDTWTYDTRFVKVGVTLREESDK